MQKRRINRQTWKYVYRTFFDVLMVLMFTWTFSYFWRDRLNMLQPIAFLNKGNLLIEIIYALLSFSFIMMLGGFGFGRGRKSALLIGQTVAMLMTNVIALGITTLVIGRVLFIQYILSQYLMIMLINTAELFVYTIIVTDLYRRIFPPFELLQIYGKYQNTLPHKMNLRDDKYHIDASISYTEELEEVFACIDRYDAVLINDIPSEVKNKILKYSFDRDKRVYFTPKISDILVKYSAEVNVVDTPLYLCRNLGMSLPQRFVKRIIDIVLSSIGIVIASPIMLAVAIAIRLYDHGPAIYKQVRCTRDQREFKMYKFRSMVQNAEKDGKARLAAENDDRITPVGRFIRATRLDELPQLFNIFMGDMSIVGPRPERPQLIREYQSTIPEFAYRTHVKAGLTGYAQVYGRYNTTSYDKLKLDIIYVQRQSLALDLQLILMTICVVFMKDSTQGLEEGATNANVLGERKDTEETGDGDPAESAQESEDGVSETGETEESCGQQEVDILATDEEK